jgi:hypothetical protein
MKMDTIQALRVVGYKVMVIHDAHVTRVYLTSPVFNKNKDHLTKKFSHHKFNLESNNNIGNDDSFIFFARKPLMDSSEIDEI